MRLVCNKTLVPEFFTRMFIVASLSFSATNMSVINMNVLLQEEAEEYMLLEGVITSSSNRYAVRSIKNGIISIN